MTSAATGAMQEFGSRPPGRGCAGLVLLYAEPFERLPAAWLLETGRNVVGREPPATVTIPVDAVSRVHAEIVWDRGGWVLRDLGSTNGTLVDGSRVTEGRLEDGQEVRCGDAILKFVADAAESMAAYRIDGAMLGGAERRGHRTEELVGGFQMDRIAGEIERIAKSPISVVLLGESGTGKEVVARAIHHASSRRGHFRAINCAAIPENLLESELFGYKRGAFSGADRDKQGLIRAADGGTLLLDEIGDMPMEAQAKLLRVLQSRELYPVGATTPEPVDVRVVCATHQDLARLQREDRFREDLFARLNEYQLQLPPLRDRKEDMLLLLRTFLARHGRPELRPSFRFMTALLHHDWPYNVRELEACVKRSIALAEAPILDADLLPEAIRDAMADYGRPPYAREEAPSSDDPESPLRHRTPTEEELRNLLQRHGGNVAAAGREIGKARMQIHRWVQRYGIDLGDFRQDPE